MTRGPQAFLTDDEREMRRRAHVAVNRAIRRGELVRGPCERCGTIAAHHRNGYENPLDVVWLCSSHHGMEHASMSNQQRAERQEKADLGRHFTAVYAEYPGPSRRAQSGVLRQDERRHG
jgi:hypothetical protein